MSGDPLRAGRASSRSLTLATAVLVITSLSAGLFAAGARIRREPESLLERWWGEIHLSIFLADDVTDAERASIEADLRTHPDVKSVLYESKQQAYEHFKEQFRDSPAVVANASPEILPESFRVRLKDPDRFEVVNQAFAGRAGVDEVIKVGTVDELRGQSMRQVL